ncbi:transposase [Methanosarcina sp. DH1]|uniref:transposase n=1 Tax=Methanosarcina sp. DH1 TaxID=2605695 RepID=UPI001E39C26F|nr:transposase [Methanosarcina sp. DH1]MCC4765471.1 transposase [Methanosarcina sp. DH1]
MIKIIDKGYKYLLLQLSDFLGIAKTIVVSLKSIEGRKKYENLFGKKIKDKKENIKVYALHTNQSLLIDFISNLFEKSTSSAIFHDYIHSKSSNFKIIFQDTNKKNKKNAKSNRRCITIIFQTLLSDFFEDTINVLKRKINIPYRVKPLIVKSKDYMETVLPLDQILAFQHIKTFKGYLGNLFALNPSLDSYFNDLQVSMGYMPQLEELAFNNIFKLEVSRCKLGYSNLESFIRDYNQNQAIGQELKIRSKEKITLSSYRRNLKMIYPYLDKYAGLLIKECRNLNLIGDKIWIWDRRFFECNCSGLKNKETGLLSDPDAGHYVKKTGKYSVLSGTGYTDTCIVDSWWGLPIYWDAVNASKNDNTIFQDTINQCMESTTVKPFFVIADAGPDSHPSNETVVEKGVIPIIAARKNSAGNILKTEKGTHFRAKYIPRIYHKLLGKLYNIRTTVERKNSNDVVGYNRSKTPTRGKVWAKTYVSISNIAALLTALTAFKVGRHELIRAPGAFRRLNI